MDADKVGHYAAVAMTLMLCLAGIVLLFMHDDRGMNLIALAVPSSGVARATGKNNGAN